MFSATTIPSCISRVGQLNAPGDVADRPDVVGMGFQAVVNDFDPASMKLDADLLKIHAVSVGLSSDAE